MPQPPASAVLTLVDAFVPKLTAGEYTLQATQTLYVEIEPNKFDYVPKSDSKKFCVRGPRFNLAPDEIYSRYPADGHRGAYHRTVPHVVCRRKALPWERPLDPNDPPDRDSKKAPEPWMALLLFDEAELPDPPFTHCSFGEVVKPPAGTRGPTIELDPWEKENFPAEQCQERNNRCTVLDISLKLFRQVAPRLDELPYLTHARLVETHDKEDVYGVGDGWFAVVLANRLPAEKKRNVAVLVSLEGVGDLIKGDEPALATDSKVRLVVLDHWAFVSEGETFEERVEHLHKGKDPWLRVSDGTNVENASVATALEVGYAPLQHRLRHGDSTVSWYRGPLVPVVIPPATLNLIFANADEALQYDADTGLLDASYAAAWQLGRLLALQAPEFARTLFHSESGYVAAALIDKAETTFADFNPKESDDERSARQTARLQRTAQVQRDDLMVALALEWLA
jgi:hypothetical protein